MMKLFSILLMLAIAPLCTAQTTTAKLGPVNKSGLHRIFLQPEIRSHTELFLNDFRIYDTGGNQVPYQIPDRNYDGTLSRFIDYKILSREVVPNKKTSIVVEIPKPELKDITLKIANAEVRKKFSISGSNDLKQWFGLVNQRELSEISSESSTDNVKIIFLPLNSYRYIRFDIDDKKTLPLNILEIGDIIVQKRPHRTAELKPAKMTFEEDKTQQLTRVHVTFDRPQLVSEVRFDIAAPNNYNRKARVFKNVPYRYKKKDGLRMQTISSFPLNSAQENAVYDPFFEKEFYIEIDNRDNPPLTITDIKFIQKLQWIVADLKAGETYTVKTGNPKLGAPDYDIDIPQEKLHDSLPEAKITDIEPNRRQAAQTGEQSLWQNPWFLWTCIVIAALVILYFTSSLVKDMKRE